MIPLALRAALSKRAAPESKKSKNLRRDFNWNSTNLKIALRVLRCRRAARHVTWGPVVFRPPVGRLGLGT